MLLSSGSARRSEQNGRSPPLPGIEVNRFDDANDEVIHRRLEVDEPQTCPVPNYYPPDKIYRIDATMSQIRVLSEIVKLFVPLKNNSTTVHAPLT